MQMEQFCYGRGGEEPLNDEEILHIVMESVEAGAQRYGKCSMEALRRVLIIPPDYTRMHSYAGRITAMLADTLKRSDPPCEVDIMPALGTHEPMTEHEIGEFFGEGLQADRIFIHNWKTDVVKLGEIPSRLVEEVSGGLVRHPIEVEVDFRLLDGYDLIISVGQVVPHEIAGMANYSKNIFVGCGGSAMISKTHMMAATCGLEKVLGHRDSPVRTVFDYAEENFISNLPLVYLLTVTSQTETGVHVHGLYGGRGRPVFDAAAELSARKNITYVTKKIKKAVVYLDEREYKSTWLGNKSIYRTRMALDQDAELIIIGPGVKKFGEDDEVDQLIRKFGYIGRLNVLELMKGENELSRNLSAASHLIYGSSDGRFSITYCTDRMERSVIEGVGYRYMPVGEAMRMVDPSRLVDGYNILESGEEIFFISNPALGLWIYDQDRAKA